MGRPAVCGWCRRTRRPRPWTSRPRLPGRGRDAASTAAASPSSTTSPSGLREGHLRRYPPAGGRGAGGAGHRGPHLRGRSMLITATVASSPLNADICATSVPGLHRPASETRPNGPPGRPRSTPSQPALLWNGSPILPNTPRPTAGRSVPGSRPYLWSVEDPDDAASRTTVGGSTSPPRHRALFNLAGPLMRSVTRVGDDSR